MKRRIINIDTEKCTGCGQCAQACHEGAIGIKNGKAVLLRDDYCDGLGDCLPTCPTGAITFTEREAAPYDEAAVKTHKENRKTEAKNVSSELTNWPVQIKLVNTRMPIFDGADILIAAGCTAYAYGAFHDDFIKDRITLIACPKLDGVDYSGKLAEIFLLHDVKSITVTRMEVPCCGGLEYMINKAIANSGKDIPVKVFTISAEGKIL